MGIHYLASSDLWKKNKSSANPDHRGHTWLAPWWARCWLARWTSPSPDLFQPQVANQSISIARDSHALWYRMGILILTCSEGNQNTQWPSPTQSERVRATGARRLKGPCWIGNPSGDRHTGDYQCEPKVDFGPLGAFGSLSGARKANTKGGGRGKEEKKTRQNSA